MQIFTKHYMTLQADLDRLLKRKNNNGKCFAKHVIIATASDINPSNPTLSLRKQESFLGYHVCCGMHLLSGGEHHKVEYVARKLCPHHVRQDGHHAKHTNQNGNQDRSHLGF